MKSDRLNVDQPHSSSGQPSRKTKSMARYIPFLACLSDQELWELEQFITVRKFEKDSVVLWEEDSCKYLYLIYSGKVKAVKTWLDGKEHILAIHKKGEFFGEMGLLDGKTFPAMIVAMENTEVGLISKNTFERHLLSNPKVLKEIISVFCLRLRQAWLKISVLSHSDAESRVRAVLELIALQHGVMDPRGMIISFRLTHKDIGLYSSLSRETVTRQLLKLAETGEIEVVDDKCILLKHEFLQRMQTL